MTRIDGGARNGYCSKASLRSEAVPSRTVRIAMTIATIGRRMKNCAIGPSRRLAAWPRALSAAWSAARRRPRPALAAEPTRRRRASGGRRPGRRGRLGLHLHPGPHLLDALHDHALPALQPARHDDEVSDALVQGHGPERDLVSLVHHQNRLLAPGSPGRRAAGRGWRSARSSTTARTRPNCPGRRSFSGLGNSASKTIVPVLGSTVRSSVVTRPLCGWTVPSARTSSSCNAVGRRPCARPPAGRTGGSPPRSRSWRP